MLNIVVFVAYLAYFLYAASAILTIGGCLLLLKFRKYTFGWYVGVTDLVIVVLILITLAV